MAVERPRDERIVVSFMSRQIREHVVAQHGDELPGELVHVVRVGANAGCRFDARLGGGVSGILGGGGFPRPRAGGPPRSTALGLAGDLGPALARGGDEGVLGQEHVVPARGVDEDPLHLGRARVVGGLGEAEVPSAVHVDVQEGEPASGAREGGGETLRAGVEAVDALVGTPADEETRGGVLHAHVARRAAPSPAPAVRRHGAGADEVVGTLASSHRQHAQRRRQEEAKRRHAARRTSRGGRGFAPPPRASRTPNDATGSATADTGGCVLKRWIDVSRV